MTATVIPDRCGVHRARRHECNLEVGTQLRRFEGRSGLRARAIAAGLLLCAVVCRHAIAINPPEDPTTLTKWLRREYPAQAAILRKPVENMRCKFTGVLQQNDGKRVSETKFTGEFFVKGDARQRIRGELDGKRGEEDSGWVLSTSSERSFELRRDAVTAGYVIDSFDDRGKSATSEKHQRRAAFLVDRWVRAAFAPTGVALTEAFASDALQSVRVVTQNGRELLEASIVFPDPSYGYERGTVLLDPAKQLAVREYHFKFLPDPNDPPGTVVEESGAVEATSYDGLVFPRKVRNEQVTTRASGERFVGSWQLEMSDVVFGAVDDAQFTLAAFGLPEISLKGRGGWYPLNGWLFWCLVAMAVVGWVYLRKTAHRKAGAT